MCPLSFQALLPPCLCSSCVRCKDPRQRKCLPGTWCKNQSLTSVRCSSSSSQIQKKMCPGFSNTHSPTTVQVLGRDAVFPVPARGFPMHVLDQEKAGPASRVDSGRQAPGPAGVRGEDDKQGQRERHVGRRRCPHIGPVFGVPGDGPRGPGGVEVSILLPGTLHADVSPASQPCCCCKKTYTCVVAQKIVYTNLFLEKEPKKS